MRLSKAYNLNHEFDGLVQLTQVFSSFLIDFFSWFHHLTLN